MKYLKLYEEYVSSELANVIKQDISHMVQEPKFKSGNDPRAELFAGQNANMYQDLDAEGNLVGASELDLPYIIGYSKDGGTLHCYNFEHKLKNLYGDTEEEFKEAFLSYFNSYFKKNYKNIVIEKKY